ncbi:transposase, partial [Weissella confusa]
INGLTNKNIGQKQLLNYAKKLYKAASLAYSEVSKESDTVMQVSYWAKRTAEIQDLQNAQINKMHSIVRDYPEYKHFLSLPGVGQNTAVRLIAELGDLRRFSSVRKLNAYVGIGHGKRSSGMITNPEKITHTGNAHARRLIFNVVANMRKAWRSGLGKPNHLMEYDKKRRSENSKLASKINTVATMDRVLRTLFNLVKLNQD